MSSAVLSQKFILDLPMGDYEELTFVCSENGEAEAFQLGSIENDLAGDQVIFVAQRLGATATTPATTTIATTTSTNETGIIPSIINGVLDFFGINTGTTTTATTEISPADSTAASSTETAPLPQGEIISPPVATTTQASFKNSMLAAVGLFSLGTGHMFVAIVILGILFLLAFVLSRKNKTTKQ